MAQTARAGRATIFRVVETDSPEGSIMAEQKIVPSTAGVVVSTAITAGGDQWQHAEGVVVSTAISAGAITENHAEGFVAPVSDEAVPDGYASGGTSAAGANA